MWPGGKAGGRTDAPCWLSRALYRCKHLPLASHVAPSERRAVLRNLLLAWAPFDQAEYRVVWQGDAVLAVAWDRVAVGSLLAAAEMSSSTPLWPETFLREPPAKDGLRVVESLEGVEAQFWRGGTLAATRWWPRLPDALDAQTWLHSLGAEATAATALPGPVAAAWRHRPWADLQSLDSLSSTTSRLERVAVGAALVGFAALTGAQAHQVLAAYEAKQAAQRDHQRQVLEAAPVLAARDRARALALEAEGLAQQMSGVMPLDLLQHLSEVMPARGMTLKELELSGLQVRLSVELAPELPRSTVVKELQAGGWLSKVSEARDNSNRGWVVLDATLLGQRAPPSAARPALAAASPLPTTAPPAVARVPAPAPAPPAQPVGAGPVGEPAANPSTAPEVPASRPEGRRGFIPSPV